MQNIYILKPNKSLFTSICILLIKSILLCNNILHFSPIYSLIFPSMNLLFQIYCFIKLCSFAQGSAPSEPNFSGNNEHYSFQRFHATQQRHLQRDTLTSSTKKQLNKILLHSYLMSKVNFLISNLTVQLQLLPI